MKDEKQFMSQVMERVLSLLDSTKKGDYPLAKEIGLGRSSIQSWRNNKSNASAYALMQIADYFNVSMDYLVGREVVSNKTISNMDTVTRIDVDKSKCFLEIIMENETLSRIEDLIKKNNLTANKVAIACKLQSNAFTYWKNKKAKPSIDALTKIADYFNVSIDYLVGREVISNESISNNVTSDPLLNKIAQLNELQKAKVEAYVDGLKETNLSISNAFKQGQINEINNQQQLTKNKNQLN